MFDIFFNSQLSDDFSFDLSNPTSFIRRNCTYILVFNGQKDGDACDKMRNCDKLGKNFTPDCLFKFKELYFKDAYAYTPDFFEQRFVKRFD